MNPIEPTYVVPSADLLPLSQAPMYAPVAVVPGPDGRPMYALPVQAPVPVKPPAVSPILRNVALGGVGLTGTGTGVWLLTGALAQVPTLVTLGALALGLVGLTQRGSKREEVAPPSRPSVDVHVNVDVRVEGK